jgi:hypothetical protein
MARVPASIPKKEPEGITINGRQFPDPLKVNQDRQLGIKEHLEKRRKETRYRHRGGKHSRVPIGRDPDTGQFRSNEKIERLKQLRGSKPIGRDPDTGQFRSNEKIERLKQLRGSKPFEEAFTEECKLAAEEMLAILRNKAREGDAAAAKYIVDRALGKVGEAKRKGTADVHG